MREHLTWHSPTLQDINFLKENLENSELTTNDCSLANLFLLRQKYETQIAIKNGFLFRYYNGKSTRKGYGFPLKLKDEPNFNLNSAIKEIQFDAKNEKRPIQFCLCTSDQKNQISQILPIDWDSNRDDSDYIYLTSDLAELNGKDYHKKKNHVTHFINEYGKNWEFRKLTRDSSDEEWQDALFVANEWLSEQENDDEALENENLAIKEAIENHAKLSLLGGIIYVDEEPVAMTIASKISEAILDINYEKALFDYAQEGAYSAINYFFARNSQDYTFINREEDLGLEGLRKSKLSYKPQNIVDKFYGVLC